MAKHFARKELIINTSNAIEQAVTYKNPLIPFAFNECDEDGHVTAYAFNSEPNEPTVLDCNDKMINEI